MGEFDLLAGLTARLASTGQLDEIVDPVLHEIAVLGFTGAFVGLNRTDLASWYYSAIGDEYGFYDASHATATGSALPNIFSQDGVFGYHPVLSTAFRGLLMRVLGLDASTLWRKRRKYEEG